MTNSPSQKQLLRGGSTLFLSQISIQLIRLARNFVLARFLTPEDFGVASTFAVILTALEFMSDLSLEKFLIRDPRGDEERLQRTLTSLSIGRYALSALAIFLLAGPVSQMFDVPDAKSAYQLFALVPLLRCGLHLDIFRVQRVMNFKADIYANIISQLASLVLAGILVAMTREYTAIVWGSILQSAIFVGVTHKMAERPFRAGWQTDYALDALKFGWPLMINGLVLMLVTLADRMIIGSVLGMAPLAVYTVAVLLVTAPGSSLIRSCMSVTLPWLSKTQDQPIAFQRNYDQMGHVLAVVAVVVFVPIVLIGTDIIELIFGADYRGSDMLVGLLALSMAVRLLRVQMINAFLALGRTRDLMWAETSRVLGIVLAAIVVWSNGGLVFVALALTVGECLAYGFCMVQLNRRSQAALLTDPSVYIGPAIVFGLSFAALWLLSESSVQKVFVACFLCALYAVWQTRRIPALQAQARRLWLLIRQRFEGRVP